MIEKLKSFFKTFKSWLRSKPSDLRHRTYYTDWHIVHSNADAEGNSYTYYGRIRPHGNKTKKVTPDGKVFWNNKDYGIHEVEWQEEV